MIGSAKGVTAKNVSAEMMAALQMKWKRWHARRAVGEAFICPRDLPSFWCRVVKADNYAMGKDLQGLARGRRSWSALMPTPNRNSPTPPQSENFDFKILSANAA